MPQNVVHSDPHILSGTPVFVGTRVPARTLLDYVQRGDSVDDFLEDFPGVTREQAIRFLEAAEQGMEPVTSADQPKPNGAGRG
jgi:uncharacterized protein (DUF433 family)